MSAHSPHPWWFRPWSWPAGILLGLVKLYQVVVSPVLPALFGPACGCRFYPSCSHYAAGALREHGAVGGVMLTAIRLVKCAPWHPGGIDPVPPRRGAARFSCQRVAPATPNSLLAR